MDPFQVGARFIANVGILFPLLQSSFVINKMFTFELLAQVYLFSAQASQC